MIEVLSVLIVPQVPLKHNLFSFVFDVVGLYSAHSVSKFK